MKKNKRWKLLRSEEGLNASIFKLRFDWMKNPRNQTELRVTVVEMTDWVNIVAITPEGKILVVKQYRFGNGKITTEIPAGILDDAEEIPKNAAIRELREETGYTTENWEHLGWVEPNPAFQNNRLHQFLAKDVRKTHEVAQDEGEDILFCEMTLEEVKNEIAEGRMRNSLSLLTLSRVFDIWA